MELYIDDVVGLVIGMPRYFFHVYDGMCSRDEEGDEFAEIGFGRELFDDGERPDEADFRMGVADEHGTVLHVIRSHDVSDQ
jgi:hypothetical protein